MKLKDFVERTILDITEGVAAAQKSSPHWVAPGRVNDEVQMHPQMISFEVVVTTSKEVDGSIDVWSIATGKGAVSSENVNKISFEVPIYFQAPRDK